MNSGRPGGTPKTPPQNGGGVEEPGPIATGLKLHPASEEMGKPLHHGCSPSLPFQAVGTYLPIQVLHLLDDALDHRCRIGKLYKLQPPACETQGQLARHLVFLIFQNAIAAVWPGGCRTVPQLARKLAVAPSTRPFSRLISMNRQGNVSHAPGIGWHMTLGGGAFVRKPPWPCWETWGFGGCCLRSRVAALPSPCARKRCRQLPLLPHGPGSPPVPLYGLEQTRVRSLPLGRWQLRACHPTLFRPPAICGATLVLGASLAGTLAPRGFPFAGREDHRKAGRPDDVFCVAPGAAFVVTFLGCGVLGSLRSGVAAVRFGDPLRADPRGFSRLGKASARKAAVLPRFPEQQLPLGAIGVGTPVRLWQKCAAAFCCLQGSQPSSGQRDLPSRSPQPFSQAAQSPGNCRLPVLPAGGHPEGQERSRIAGGPCFLRFRGGLWRLCVHLQVFSFFREFPLSKKWFFLTRFHGLGAAGTPGAAAHLPREAQWVWSSCPLKPGITASMAGGLSLLLMCLAFLVFVGRSLTNAKKEPLPLAPSQKDVESL